MRKDFNSFLSRVDHNPDYFIRLYTDNAIKESIYHICHNKKINKEITLKLIQHYHCVDQHKTATIYQDDQVVLVYGVHADNKKGCRLTVHDNNIFMRKFFCKHYHGLNTLTEFIYPLALSTEGTVLIQTKFKIESISYNDDILAFHLIEVTCC